MRRLRIVSQLVPALTLLAFTACANTTDPARVPGNPLTAEPYFLTGTITQVGDSWGYRMKGEPGTSYRVNEAYFTLAPNARILRADGTAATETELTVGRSITLWITGAIAESLPVQVGARLIVLK